MNGRLNNSTKDAARALPDTTCGCGNPPSTTAVLPRADLGFTCRRKSLGTDQALRSSDQDVAAQREHAAGSDGCAVDRGDDRLFAFHDGVEALSDEPVVPWIGSDFLAEPRPLDRNDFFAEAAVLSIDRRAGQLPSGCLPPRESDS